MNLKPFFFLTLSVMLTGQNAFATSLDPEFSKKNTLLAAAGSGEAIPTPAARTPRRDSTHGLSPAGQEAAVLLGILPEIEQLIDVNRSRTGASSFDLTDQELGLKIRILDKIMGESLEVRMVSDRIDRELAWAFTGKEMVDGRKQRHLNYLFDANFMQGGVLGTIAGGVILHGYPKYNADILLVSSGVGLMLSSMAFMESRRGSKSMDGEPTVLADVLSLQQSGETDRPDLIYKFLNSVPPGSSTGKTRLQTMMAGWQKNSYIHSGGEQEMQKLAALQPADVKYRETSRLLAHRIRMLFDTQYTIEQLDAGLLDVLRACSR